MDPLKILLVDDSKTARYKLRLALQEQGVEVHTAESAETALSQVKRISPDAILMDHTMPGMTGLDALEILKGDPETDAIPVIMCSAHEDEAFAARAKELGALGILPKADPAETAKKLPGTLDQIRQTLASAFVTAAPAASAQRTRERKAAPAPSPAPRHGSAPGTSHSQLESMLARRLGALDQELRAEIESRYQTLEQSLATSERILIHRIEQAATPPQKQGAEQTSQVVEEAARVATKEVHALIDKRLGQEGERLLEQLKRRMASNEPTPAVERALRRMRTSLYALSAGAAVVGVGAAAGVFVLLG